MLRGISHMLQDIISMLTSILAIGGFTCTLAMALYIKRAMSPEGIYERLRENVRYMMQDEEMQKALFTVGGLISNGAKAGFGLNRRGGKFGVQELIMGLVGKYLHLDAGQEQQQPAQPAFGSE